MTTQTSSRGFTLIEVIIANAILAALIIMVMITIVAASRPTSDATQRSFLASQGNAGLASMTRELVSGLPDLTLDTTNFCLGDSFATGTQTVTINADSAPGPSALHDYDTSASGRLFYGRCIRFLPVTGFDANDYLNDTAPYYGLEVGNEVIFAFVADEADNDVDDDGDGLVDEMKLVRCEGTLVVDMLKDIPRGDDGVVGATSAADVAPEPPYFELRAPSDVRIVFRMRRRIDYDESRTDDPTTLENDKYVFVQTEFTEKVNMRNANN